MSTDLAKLTSLIANFMEKKTCITKFYKVTDCVHYKDFVVNKSSMSLYIVSIN